MIAVFNVIIICLDYLGFRNFSLRNKLAMKANDYASKKG